MIAIGKRGNASSEVGENGFKKEIRFNEQREARQTRYPDIEGHVDEQKHIHLKHQESMCLECCVGKVAP